ncbi:uncharacterized protein B0H18DRAFT_973208 [Fomitopsis serialis]|uniref:uncharacterized protein n=1 Tax=Fomitopsis serialis TaxID=139415 RepID=UPI0020071EC1|nr:uncharacterized protein B0H18DRAFT_973208 [Neoantrodia serialis]KAH9936294.1 hypothetical protein B0H18DRAFT_973208 [Neoantrodia serialis]
MTNRVDILWGSPGPVRVRPDPCTKCNRMIDRGQHETNCGATLPVGLGDDGDEDMREADRSCPPTFDQLKLADPKDTVRALDNDLMPQQALFVQHVLEELEDQLELEELELAQYWDELTPMCTQYHEELDEEQYSTKVAWRIPLPNVKTLHIDDVHPKLLYAFLTHFDLPKVTTLNLTYDIDGQPDRKELLLVLLNVGADVLEQLDRFDSTRELHCHHIDVLERFYTAIEPVKKFTLHYWADYFNCQEWLIVLQAQWRRVLEHPELGEKPYLPYLSLLTAHGLAGPKLFPLLNDRRLVKDTIYGVVYAQGHLYPHEYDRLNNELRHFKCYIEVDNSQ